MYLDQLEQVNHLTNEEMKLRRCPSPTTSSIPSPSENLDVKSIYCEWKGQWDVSDNMEDLITKYQQYYGIYIYVNYDIYIYMIIPFVVVSKPSGLQVAKTPKCGLHRHVEELPRCRIFGS